VGEVARRSFIVVTVGGLYPFSIRANLAPMQPKYELARKMRRALTRPEFLLWDRIKQRQPGAPVFRRQYAFGPYILDFYCIQAKLAIEVDGQEHGVESQINHDTKRDAWLRSKGIDTYRIPAYEILKDVGDVADGIYDLAIERLKEV
jgi:very-short-patch-repair endonuclease